MPSMQLRLVLGCMLGMLVVCSQTSQTSNVSVVCVVQDRGLIPRVFQELFAQIKEKQMQQVGSLQFIEIPFAK